MLSSRSFKASVSVLLCETILGRIFLHVSLKNLRDLLLLRFKLWGQTFTSCWPPALISLKFVTQQMMGEKKKSRRFPKDFSRGTGFFCLFCQFLPGESCSGSAAPITAGTYDRHKPACARMSVLGAHPRSYDGHTLRRRRRKTEHQRKRQLQLSSRSAFLDRKASPPRHRNRKWKCCSAPKK